MTRASSRDALVYTVRELDRHAARIMRQVEETGRPAVITRDGRFVAIIEPLAPGQVESRVLAVISREVSKPGRDHRATAVTARSRRFPRRR